MAPTVSPVGIRTEEAGQPGVDRPGHRAGELGIVDVDQAQCRRGVEDGEVDAHLVETLVEQSRGGGRWPDRACYASASPTTRAWPSIRRGPPPSVRPASTVEVSNGAAWLDRYSVAETRTSLRLQRSKQSVIEHRGQFDEVAVGVDDRVVEPGPDVGGFGGGHRLHHNHRFGVGPEQKMPNRPRRERGRSWTVRRCHDRSRGHTCHPGGARGRHRILPLRRELTQGQSRWPEVISTGNFLITSTGGRYVFQRLNGRVFPDLDIVVNNVERVVAHLEASGRVAPVLVGDPRRCLSHRAPDGSVWRAFRYLEGTVGHACPARSRRGLRSCSCLRRIRHGPGRPPGPPAGRDHRRGSTTSHADWLTSSPSRHPTRSGEPWGLATNSTGPGASVTVRWLEAWWMSPCPCVSSTTTPNCPMCDSTPGPVWRSAWSISTQPWPDRSNRTWASSCARPRHMRPKTPTMRRQSTSTWTCSRP